MILRNLQIFLFFYFSNTTFFTSRLVTHKIHKSKKVKYFAVSSELNPDSVSSISKPRPRGSVTNPRVSSGADGFNRRYLEEVVSEAMEDWCGGVEQRILNMHYSLIRILQQHQV